jgi:hypothetical protein
VPEVPKVLKVPEVPKAANFVPMVPLPIAHMLAHPTIVITFEMPCQLKHRVGEQGACPFFCSVPVAGGVPGGVLGGVQGSF